MATTPDHALTDAGPWALWRDVALRGTGFAINLLEPLACPALGAMATRSLALNQQAIQALRHLGRLYLARVKSAPAEAERMHWHSGLKLLQRGRCPPPSGDAEMDAQRSRVVEIQGAANLINAELASTFEAADQRAGLVLQQWAADARLREAMAWQNPQVLRTGLAPLLHPADGQPRNAQRRKHEQLVARYLQRYTTKNDTIGFFGPVGWAQVEGASNGLDLHAGPSLAVNPQVSFEPWVAQALASALTRDAALRPYLLPWRHPAWRAGPNHAVVVLERAFALPPLERELFANCSGRLRVVDLPGALGADADIVNAALARLEAAQLVFLTPRVPLGGDSLQALCDWVAATPDGTARSRWLDGLLTLLRGGRAAAACFGQAEAVASVQHALAEPFTRLSSQAATRSHGGTYAARTLLVMDARRDLDLRIGEPLARELMSSMRPVLDAAHWFSCQVHAQLTDFAQGLFRSGQRGGRMPLDRLWFEMQHDATTVSAIVADVAEQLAERWATVLPASGAAAATVARAAAVFADCAPGWPGARFQGPDVMLASASASDLSGAFFVLGELHAADTSLLRQVFLSQHPHPQRLLDAFEVDLAAVELRALMRTDALLGRTRTLPESPLAFDIECDSVVSLLPAARVLRSGALWVVQGENELRIVDDDHGHDFPLHAFLGPQAGALSASEFHLYAPAPHRPRVQTGRLVVAREAWRVPMASLNELTRKSKAASLEGYVAVRRLALDLGWPRRVFYRVASEPKPLFLDLDSPTYVTLFLRTLAAAQRSGDAWLDVSEMLPGPEHCWLPDAAGARYACEWRMLFVRRPIPA